MLNRHDSPSPPARSDDPATVRRIRGTLAGLGLGDAIGKLVDKRPGDQVEAETLALLEALATGGDPPTVFTGRVTDDTLLALALATTVITAGSVSRGALEKKLRVINPNGGRQVYKLKAAAGPLDVAADGATNGCVPRSAPIGCLYYPDELGDLCYDTLKTVTLTHAHPDAVMAALAFRVLISHGVAGHSQPNALSTLESALAPLARIAGGGINVGEAVLEHSAARHRFRQLPKYVDYLEGTVGMSVAAGSSAVAGICLGVSGCPPRQVLPVLLRRRAGWDLDSAGAIYGAMAGAFMPEDVPRQWAARVERYADSSFTQIAQDLHKIRLQRQRA